MLVIICIHIHLVCLFFILFFSCICISHSFCISLHLSSHIHHIHFIFHYIHRYPFTIYTHSYTIYHICIHACLFISHYIFTFAFTFISYQIKLSMSIPYNNKEITSNAYIKSHSHAIHEIIKNHQYISYIYQQCFRVQNHGSISPLIARRHGPHKEHIKNIKKVLLHNHLSVVPRAITSPGAPVGPRR